MNNIYQRAIDIFNDHLGDDLMQTKVTADDIGKVVGIVDVVDGKPVFGPVEGGAGSGGAVVINAVITDDGLLCNKTFQEVRTLADDSTVVVLRVMSGEVPIPTYYELLEVASNLITFAHVYKYPGYTAWETCTVNMNDIWSYSSEDIVVKDDEDEPESPN